MIEKLSSLCVRFMPTFVSPATSTRKEATTAAIVARRLARCQPPRSLCFDCVREGARTRERERPRRKRARRSGGKELAETGFDVAAERANAEGMLDWLDRGQPNLSK